MEFNATEPIYLQIGDMVCERILTGDWQEEDRIPSVREMAVTTEVNPNTVMRTYAYLQERDIIQNRRGIGYFVAPGGREKTRQLMRSAFIEKELPRLVRFLRLLEIDFAELRTLIERCDDETETS